MNPNHIEMITRTTRIIDGPPRPRILFILKQRMPGPYDSWSHSSDGKPMPSGLSVSVEMLSVGLTKLDIDHKIVQVVDNNCIDREVSVYKPTHVIIEAFWVVPAKFDVLRPLHPNVTWIVRNHSKMDFLSHEGGMTGWALEYIRKGIVLACNSMSAVEAFRALAISSDSDPRHVIYLPNYYDIPKPRHRFCMWLWELFRFFGILGRTPRLKDRHSWNVGCYGAVRPLKNHLNQAIGAIYAADSLGFKLRFHINSTRVEGKAEPILRTMQVLFSQHPQHELVEDSWKEHRTFLADVAKLDVMTQVSLSETFNIVAADAISQNVPVLGSEEIPFLPNESTVDPRRPEAIGKALVRTWLASGNGMLQKLQRWYLYCYGQKTLKVWKAYFRHPGC